MLHWNDLHRDGLLLNTADQRGVRPRAGLRPAVAADLPVIHALLQADGLPLDGVADSLADFVVAERDGEVLGAGGLEIAGPDVLLRSVVVAEAARGEGLGLAITMRLLENARARGLATIWLLTETAPAFFARFGFRRVPREAAPPALAATPEFRFCCPASAVTMARRLTPIGVLVLCTANSARSQLAEALLRHRGGDLVRAASAGTTPGAGPHPGAVEALRQRGIAWQGKTAKSIAAVGDDWELVITVCDGALESCPVLPGHATVHWGLADPAGAGEVDAAFDATAEALTARIDALLALPWAVMSNAEIARAAAEIHRTG